MSVQVSLATATPSTNLPSFAQTFHTMRPTNPTRDQHHHTLPSITTLAVEHESPVLTRKRPRRGSRGADTAGSESPRAVRVKEEIDELVDTVDVHSHPPTFEPAMHTAVENPPLQQHHAKKRRTLGRLDTDAGVSTTDRPSGTSTPISPMVHSFPRLEDPQKEKSIQKSASVHFSSASRTSGVSDSPRNGVRRTHHTSSPPASMAAPSMASIPQILPAPPSSFGSRRGISFNGPRKKPADLLISQEAKISSSSSNLRPVIQSAPAIPRGAIQAGRFPPIEIPSLPPLTALPPTLGVHPTVRRVPGQVPPTPNRPSMLHSSSATAPAMNAVRGVATTNVAIASSLIPPTPTALRAPGYSAERTAFLAPFETFYDALSDAKELKTWLFDNVQRASTLTASLERQQERMDETVRSAVERAVAPVHDEVRRLRERISDLESSQRTSRNSLEARPPIRAVQSSGSPAEVYVRPVLARHPSSPALASGTESPAPYDARRQPTSAARFEPRGSTELSRQLVPLSALTHGSTSAHSSRERERPRGSSYRDSPSTTQYHGHDVVSLSRRQSGYSVDDHGRDRSRSRSPPPRRPESQSPGHGRPHDRSPEDRS